MTRQLAAWVVGIGMVMALVGCTPAPTAPSSPPSAPTSPATTPATSATPGVVTDVKTQPGTSTGYAGALKDVALATCDAAQSPSMFAGTVTNPESTPQSYRIYVSLLANGATAGILEVDVDAVPAGETRDWSGQLNTAADGARCVLRVERTAA